MSIYNFLPEFMDNQDTSGIWILTQAQLISIGVLAFVFFLVASIFTDNLIIKLVVALVLGGSGGFFMGMKYVGITGYRIIWGGVVYYIKRFILHSTVYYPSTFPLASTLAQQSEVSEVVDANSSLPTSL